MRARMRLRRPRIPPASSKICYSSVSPAGTAGKRTGTPCIMGCRSNLLEVDRSVSAVVKVALKRR